jgi:hypothetical protein
MKTIHNVNQKAQEIFFGLLQPQTDFQKEVLYFLKKECTPAKTAIKKIAEALEYEVNLLCDWEYVDISQLKSIN